MHQPILVSEVIDLLMNDPNGTYVDGTFGRGGHSQQMLSYLNDQGCLLVFDRDHQAIKQAEDLAAKDHRVHVIPSAFATMKIELDKLMLLGKIDGILLDLGVSSPQLDQAERGFSFRFDGPLDMRMDQKQAVSAATVIATIDEEDLSLLIRDLGEEKFHRRIAKAIVEARSIEPIESTEALVTIIKSACPYYQRGKHPATRTFQALRMYVNQELEQLEQLLEDALDLLAVGGRIAIISFHSLEHKVVKRFAKQYCSGNERITMDRPQKTPRLRRVVRHVVPSLMEVTQNPRARSAILRVLEKIA